MIDQNFQFYAVLTDVGAAKQANANALGIPWVLTHMAIGDANPMGLESPALPMPDGSWTSLLNEWRRAPLNQLKVDDKDSAIIIAEQVIPAEVGGRWIREISLYDADGDLVAVANCPPTYKPMLSQGSGRTQVVRMNLVVSSSSNIQLKIDPSVVLATREFVAEELAKQDFKHSVLVATTGPIMLSGQQTIDGIALTAGVRVLVKNQAAAKDNGLYVVAPGAWTRCTDANTSAKVTPGLLVLVEKGTLNGDSAWQLVTDGPISLGVSALAFEMAFGRTGVAEGTYRSVTVDKYGRVVAATNPTTVAGYGLTDVYTKTQIDTALALKANLAGANFTGPVYVPSVPVGNNSQLAVNSAFVQATVAALVASSPAALDTLSELATALGNDPNFATTMLNLLAGKVAVGDKATQLIAEAGADNAKWMTALGVLQSVIKRLNEIGLAGFGAPLLTNFNTNNKAGVYLAYAGGTASPTPNGPPSTSNSIMGVLAMTPVNGAVHYLAVENSPSSKGRRLWLGQYNSQFSEVYWSYAMTSDQIATQAEVDAGVAGDVIVTPKTLKNGVVISPGINGFEIRPKWLGGGIKQWGRATLTKDDLWIAFPMAFPNSVRTVQVSSVDVNERLVGFGGPTKAGFVAQGYLWGGLTADANLFVKRASAEVEIMWFAEGD